MWLTIHSIFDLVSKLGYWLKEGRKVRNLENLPMKLTTVFRILLTKFMLSSVMPPPSDPTSCLLLCEQKSTWKEVQNYEWLLKTWIFHQAATRDLKGMLAASGVVIFDAQKEQKAGCWCGSYLPSGPRPSNWVNWQWVASKMQLPTRIPKKKKKKKEDHFPADKKKKF